MIDSTLYHLHSPRQLFSACIAVILILGSFLIAPQASAVDACDDTGVYDIAGQRVQLESCATAFSEENTDDDTSLQLPLGSVVSAGDLLLVNLAIDSRFDTLSADSAGWTELDAEINDRTDMTTQVWYKVATAADVALPAYLFSWADGDEKNYAQLLHFTGVASIASIPGSGVEQVTEYISNPTNPKNMSSVTPLSPFNLILRLLSVRRDGIDPTLTGPSGDWTSTYYDIFQDRADGSGNSNEWVGMASAYTYQAGIGATGTVPVATINGNNGGHFRTLAIEPYEFRFFLEDTATGTPAQSMVCGIREVTLRVTDRQGNTVPTFTGTVSLGTSTGNGNWSKTITAVDAQGSLTDVPGDDDGAASYEFVAADNGEMILNFENRNVETVNFNVTFGNWTESTTAGYTSPNLTINSCEVRISYGDADPGTMGACTQESVTLLMTDSVTAETATNYPGGTLTINNNLGSRGNYTKAAGDGTVTDGGGNGTATILWGASDSTVTLTYTDAIASNDVNFTLSENSGLAVIDSTNVTFDPDLDVVACDIRLVYPTGNTDVTSSTCQIHSLTIEIRDQNSALVTGYGGTITVSNTALAGAWSSVSANNAITDNGSGQIQYSFDGTPGTGDGGSITLGFTLGTANAAIDFNIVENSPSGYTHPASGIYDKDLDVANCRVDIQVPAIYGICSDGQTVTVSVQDRDGNAVSNFVGGIQVQTNSTFGDYAFVSGGSGGGGLSNGTANDGIATYTFSGTNTGQVLLKFTSAQIEAIQFSAVSTGAVGLTISAGSNRDLNVVACEIRISVAAGPIDVCSIIQVTFTVTDTAGTAISGFDGDIELVAQSNQGNWVSLSSGTTVDNNDGGPDNGRASYQFTGSEVGTAVTLGFRHPSVNGALSFDASDDLDSVSSLNVSGAAGQDPSINVQGCTVVVSTPDTTLSNVSQANVCAAGEKVIYTVTNSQSATATGFRGLIVLQADGVLADEGDYANAVGAPTAVLGGYGTLDNGAGNDGIATYQFITNDLSPSLGDQGVLEVVYSTNTADTVTFTASTTGITSAGGDNSLTFNACVARISFPSDTAPYETDVCTVKQVQFQIVGFNGAVVTDYTGNIALSTSTSFGTWVNSGSAQGTVSGGTTGNGGASYTFIDDGAGGAADDDGVITLDFLHAGNNASAMNINVTGSGGVSDLGTPGATFDPNLFVDVCTFQISYDGGGASTHADFTKTACTVQEVTIEVFRSSANGSGLATNYNGTVQLSTSLNHGNWSDATVSVTDVGGDDDGLATAVFVSTSAVTIDFINLNTETMNVNVKDLVNGLPGVIVEIGTADPALEITSCSPTIAAQSCADGTDKFADITIDARATNTALRGRMVLMALTWEQEDTLSSVKFNTLSAGDNFNVDMTEVISKVLDSGAFDSNTFLYGILDANLPATGGSFRGEFANSGSNSVGMCLLYLTDVEQVFPTQTVSGTENDNDPVNTSGAENTQIASTTIKTTQNNAFVVSVIGNGQGTGQDAVSYDQVSPNPPMTQLFVRNDPPESADFAISTGISPNAGLFTVDETYDSAGGSIPNRHSHLVASFNPIITGPPVPVGYVPVTLFQTYSGDISYLAVGATLRNGNNGSGNSCVFVSERSAQLTLPEIDERDTGTYPGIVDFGGVGVDDTDSTIRDAFLYWMASGDQALPVAGGTGFNTVDFVTPSGTTTVTADDVFLIDNVGGGNANDYYAAYKRVKDLMPAAGSVNGTYNVLNIDFDNGAPWAGGQGCGAGWSLIVVYENPYEEFRVVNLFHGFQPFQNSAFTLVPRNFRMAEDLAGGERPNGLVTHVTLEGDETLSNGDESLRIQDEPNSTDAGDYFVLDTPFNPPGAEFNGTVTRPVFVLTDIDPTAAVNYKYQWNSSASNATNQSAGYEIDFPGVVFPPTAEIGAENGGSWGMDIDTHYISGDQEAAEGSDDNVLFDFADQQAEEITTRYSSGQDLVLLVHEGISVQNAAIADIEVTITEGAGSTYKVGSTTSTYDIVVKNNGNGAPSYGTASGTLTLVGSVPAGMALTSVVGTGWTCTVITSAFTCLNNITAVGATPLPTVVATITIAAPDAGSPPIAFPSLSNNAAVVARVAHFSDITPPACTAATGVIPDPANCNKSAEFDNVNDLQGGVVDVNDVNLKTGNNNNVDGITTVVKGIETELLIVKAIVSLLENGGVVSPGLASALYTLTVTNNGPDIFTYSAGNREINIVDNEPGGLDFASGAGTGWTCPITGGSPDQMNCAFTGSLGVGATTVVTVSGYVTGSPGTLVSNTATVSSGLYNFDQTGTNNSSTNNTSITAPVASATEKFLLSVSSGGLSSIGDGAGALTFDDNDLIIYDPVQDIAVMYLDNSVLSYGLSDPDAVHLLPNGKVILSTASASTIGSNAQAFSENDLVLWDPISGQGSLFFDQDNADPTNNLDGENIDAVYVLDGGVSGDFIFSTTNDVSDSGGPKLDWNDSDLIKYTASTDTFAIYLNGEDAQVFNGSSADIDAAYLRTNTGDPFDPPLNEFFFSSDNQSTAIEGGAFFGQDDVVEFKPDAIPGPASATSETIFRGNVPIGVFSTPSGTNVDAARKLNALHVLESAYVGHFAIIQSQAGNACTAGEIRIVKHLNSAGHATDTDYTGSIEITADTVGGADSGTWTIVSGNGTLNNVFGGSSTNGQAVYTFVGSDNGDVTLSLNVTSDPPAAKSIDVNATNRLVQELGVEDDDFDFNLVVSNVNYRDAVSTAAYNNSDGVASWAGPWTEVDDNGSGASSGKVNALGGTLNLTSTPSSATVPSLIREANLAPFDVTETVYLNFDYSYSLVNTPDVIQLFVTVDGTELGGVGTPFATYTGLNGTNASATAVSLDLSALAPTDGSGDKFTGITKIEFRVGSGYTTSGVFSIDNVEIATGTTDCNFGSFDHFKIISNQIGLACVVSAVRIEGHDSSHTLTAPGVGSSINLSTSTGAGTWPSKITGTGTLTETGNLTDGQATYTFPATETFVELNFNYTNPDTGANNSPVGDNPLVNFNIAGLVSGIAKTELQDPNPNSVHDPSITFDEVGLIFTTGNNADVTVPTPIPFQIAGKRSTLAPFSALPTIQLVRSVLRAGNEASACSSLVPDGSLVTIKLAAVCDNPGTCSAGITTMPFINDVTPTAATINIPVSNSGAANPAGSGTDIQLLFENSGTTVDGTENIAATLEFTYFDAGKISLHAQYDIPFNNASAGTLSGDLAKGSSNSFIVRPFGFDIDFGSDRRSNSGVASVASDPSGATGPAFARAGVGFSTTVAAVAWDGADVLGASGKPAFGTDLSNNAITANFGNETGLANDPTVLVSVVTDTDAGNGIPNDNPGVPSGDVGSISSGAVFDGFNNGTSTHDMAINEVGIFDLDALLVQNSGNQTAINYFEEAASAGVIGGTANVGRIYPAYFELVSSSFENRVNQSCSISPRSASTFTYMGEDFGINFVLQAKNGLDANTKNYFGNFAKLTARGELNINAILGGVGASSNVTTRLSHSAFITISPTFMSDWTSDIGSGAANASGALTISGNLRFGRKTTAVAGSEDGPFSSVEIAFAPLDLNGDVGVAGNDIQIGSGYSALTSSTTSIFDVDVDNSGTNIYKLISGATTQFRYGRLRMEDSFGSETEALGVGVLVEYYDGSNFILNTLDSCTTINFDVTEPSLSVVANSAVPAGYITVPGDQLDEPDVPMESGTAADFTIILNGGRTAANDINGADVLLDADRPFTVGPTTGEKVGTVIVELDLNNPIDPDVPKSTLDFLKYDWRTAADLYDETPEGANYNDNPRAIIEFGSYRGHDRVINWQEIYTGPSN